MIGMTFAVGPVAVLSFGIFVKPLAKTFSSDRGTVSLCLLFLNVGSTIAIPIAGSLVDRIGARKAIPFGLTALAVCLLGLSIVRPPIWHLFIQFGMIGLLASAASPVSFSKGITNWFNRKRGLALGVATAGVGMGSFILPSLCQYLINNVGWRQTYLLLSIPVLLMATMIGIFYTNRPQQKGLLPDGELIKDPAEVATIDGMSVKDAMKTRTFWLLYFIYSLMAACAMGTLTHLSPLLTDRGFSPTYAAFATSIFGAATTVSRLLVGYLIDKVFAPYVAAVALVGAAIGVGLLWFGGGGVLLSAASLGFLLGSEADIMPYLLSRYFGRKNFGVLFGFAFSAFTMGVGAGPYLFGISFDKTHSYQFALECTCLVLVFLSILTLSLKKYKTSKFN